jgi:hypothetical protein
MNPQIAQPLRLTEITLSGTLIAAVITGRISRALQRRRTRVKTWWAALSAAREYSKNRTKHKFKRGVKSVTHHDKVRVYTQPQLRQRPKFVVRETGMFAPRLWDNTDVGMLPILPARPPMDDLWVRRLRAEFNNAALLMSGAEGPLNHVYDHRPASIPAADDTTRTPDVGQHPHPDGADDRAAEPVLAVEGGGDHHGHTGPDRRRGVQRSAAWVCPREPAVHDLVSEDDWYRAIA